MKQAQVFETLERLRQAYGHQADWWASANYVEDLVAMVLIQQTTDSNAKKALANLEGLCQLETLAHMPLAELEMRIKSSGFFRQKAKAIQALTQFFLDQGQREGLDKYETHALRKLLLSVKGVGQETADVILLYIFQRPVFVSDAYARRLYKDLGFGDYPTYQALASVMSWVGEQVDAYTAQQWHAVIDEHGKAKRKGEALIAEENLLV